MCAKALRTAALAFALTHFVLTARAQIFDSGPAAMARQQTQMYLLYGVTRARQQQYLLKRRKSSSADKAKQGAGRPVAPAQAKPATLTTAKTTFYPETTYLMPGKLAAQLGKTPEQSQELESVFAKGLSEYYRVTQKKGVVPYDVARATSFFILVNYDIYSDRRGPSPRQAEALRESVRADLLEDEVFQRMSDREKQMQYETLVVMAEYVAAAHKGAERDGNARLLGDCRELAKRNLEGFFGVPVEKIRFTDQGLEID